MSPLLFIVCFLLVPILMNEVVDIPASVALSGQPWHQLVVYAHGDTCLCRAAAVAGSLLSNVIALCHCGLLKYSLQTKLFLGSKSLNSHILNSHLLSVHLARSCCHLGMFCFLFVKSIYG